MTVFVTGGAGFIGHHLIGALIERGYHVTVLDNLHRGRMDNIASYLAAGKIRFLQGDIRDYEAVRSALAGSEVVFHLAAQSNVMGAVQDIDYSFGSNVTGTFNVLKAANEVGVRRVIFTSSREAYGEAQYLPVDEAHPQSSKNSYGASKVAGEKYCQVFQNMGAFDLVILRLANVYGAGDFNRVIPIFMDHAKQGRDLRIYGGEQVIDFVSTQIVVETLLQALDNAAATEGPTNVGSGRGTTLFELATRIQELTGSASRVIVDPPRPVEVVRFTADLARFENIFDVVVPRDPLYALSGMIDSPHAAKSREDLAVADVR